MFYIFKISVQRFFKSKSQNCKQTNTKSLTEIFVGDFQTLCSDHISFIRQILQTKSFKEILIFTQ